MKRVKYIAKRSRFCKLALSDSKKAASELRDLATGLENCRTTSDVVVALCEIFYVSERTVFRDITS
jgi:hypothetical protein